MACSRSWPHIVSVGRRLTHTAGRSGWPKSAQRKSGNNCAQAMPAGFPWGIPGMGDEIEGAMQHAPQPGRQSMGGRVAERWRRARFAGNREQLRVGGDIHVGAVPSPRGPATYRGVWAPRLQTPT